MNNTAEQKTTGNDQEHEAVKAGHDAIKAANEVDKTKSVEEKEAEEKADAEKWRNEG